MMPDSTPEDRSAALRASGIADDASALKRALGVQVAGYVLKAGLPFLLAFATRAYGVEAWGVFVAVQALVMVGVRASLFGLDKATLWWVGSHEPRELQRALVPAVLLATVSSVVLSFLLEMFGGFALERWAGTSAEQLPALQIMLLGMPLMAVTDVVLHASMGLRKMGPQVAIRDTIVPVLWLGSALVFHALGLAATGLSWAFVLSQGVGLCAALLVVSRMRVKSDEPLALRPPPELLPYALPVWMNEIANTMFLRIDALILVALTDPFTVGIWGVLTQLGNAMRSIRRAFDPILIAVTARIARAHDPERLAHALSYATQLVSLSQLPVFVFLLLFAAQLLPLYGAGFEQGETALVVLCAFWLLNGSISLPGVVLAGYGHARLGLVVTLIGIAAQVPLMFALVPSYGLTGVSIAVGLASTLQQLVQLVAMKRLTGGLHYNERARRTLWPGLGAGIAAALAWLGSNAAGSSAQATSIAAFAAFACVYGASVGAQWKRGLLRAPGQDA